MFKSSLFPLIFAIVFALAMSVRAQQPSPASGTNSNAGSTNPASSGPVSDPFINSESTPTNSRPSKQEQEDPEPATDSETGDSTLYRMRTTESVASGVMARDEGELTRKPRKREKVFEVDSTAKLPTTGTDRKFQGSLLNSSVTSIDDVSPKTDEENAAEDEGDPRFKTKRLVFKPSAEDKVKEKAPKRSTAESSPSPSPSASASPTAASR